MVRGCHAPAHSNISGQTEPPPTTETRVAGVGPGLRTRLKEHVSQLRQLHDAWGCSQRRQSALYSPLGLCPNEKRRDGTPMKRFAPWVLVVALCTASFAGWAAASADRAGPVAQLRRRVTTLEARVDRQRRDIVSLNGRVADSEDSVQQLLGRTSNLDANGQYSGTVSNLQVRLLNSCPAQFGYAYWRGGQLSHVDYSC